MLTPFAEYSCRIYAFTVLPGPTSDPVNVTTSQSGILGVDHYSNSYVHNDLSTVPNPPVINTVVNISSNSVCVIWTRPTMPNGIITSYTIRYVANSNSGSMNVPYNGEEVSTIISYSCRCYNVILDTIL